MSLLYINKIKITCFCFWIISRIVSFLPVRKPLSGIILAVNTCGPVGFKGCWGCGACPLSPRWHLLLSVDFHNQMGPSSHCEHQFWSILWQEHPKSPPASSSGVHWFCKSKWGSERVFYCIWLPGGIWLLVGGPHFSKVGAEDFQTSLVQDLLTCAKSWERTF